MECDLIYLVKIYLFILFSLLLLSCSENESKVVPAQIKDTLDASQKADLISWDIEVLFVDSSYTKAVLNARRARMFSERQLTYLDGGLKVEFLSKITGKRVSLLTADSARIDDKTKNMLAQGKVLVIADSSQTRLETTLLSWDNSNQKLFSTEFVKITLPQQTIQGWGFESDLNLTNYKIFKVSGEQK